MTSPKRPIFHHLPPPQAGFTLVEIMVGLAIGMLATLIVMQVFSVFETQKRTTTGAGDAQTNGNIALYNIARELQMAGYALMPTSWPKVYSPLECPTLTVSGVLDTSAPNGIFPVVIINGVASAGVSASDTIKIRYGDSAMGGSPMQILGMAPTANDAQVSDIYGCSAGDRTLVVSKDGASCSLSTAVSAVAAVSGVSSAYVRLMDATAAGGDANVACLGTWNDINYAVDNAGNLARNNTPLVSGIVNLQAQYGISAAGLANADPAFNTVVQWVEPTGTWAAPSVADRIRIKAIRIAVIARNAKMEVSDVTDPCNQMTNTGLCAWADSASGVAPVVDLSNSDSNWQRYRYRVFETVIPLRNVIWAKPKL